MANRRVFSVNDIIPVIYGTRIRPQDLPFGTPLSEHYWSSEAKIIQTIHPSQEDCLYIIEDQKQRIVAIAVKDTHIANDGLRVSYQDFKRYNSQEERSSILQEWRNSLIGKTV